MSKPDKNPNKKAQELADKKAQELADKEAQELSEKEALKNNDTYIMRVSTLRWGAGNRKYFYGHQRPVISRKVMGRYHKSIDLWLKKKYIEKGSYPENKKK